MSKWTSELTIGKTKAFDVFYSKASLAIYEPDSERIPDSKYAFQSTVLRTFFSYSSFKSKSVYDDKEYLIDKLLEMKECYLNMTEDQLVDTYGSGEEFYIDNVLMAKTCDDFIEIINQVYK